MKAYDLILKKRQGLALNKEEIEFLIEGYTKDEIPDYQMSAWAMAVFFQGMTPEETAYLTTAMVNSGETLAWNEIAGKVVDKHSTGGVGDKTSIVLAPLMAAAGIPFAKMSGRGLGHTGGTLDKLESFQGFRIDLSREEISKNVNEIGVVLSGQTADLVPADGKLYALRDVTATVESIPLIASSIMSKKIASGADAIVLDVKVGKGAFMKSLDDAVKLSEAMVDIGKRLDRSMTAVLSQMEEPLGNMVGNALEIKEAIDTLAGKGPEDLRELVLVIGSYLMVLGEYRDNREAAYEELALLLDNGKALEKFKEMVKAQGGDIAEVDNPELLPKAKDVIPFTASRAGYVAELDALAVGRAAMSLGAGRQKKGDPIDLGVGIEVVRKTGDMVAEGDVLAYIHSNDEKKIIEAMKELDLAYVLSEKEQEKLPLVYRIIQ